VNGPREAAALARRRIEIVTAITSLGERALVWARSADGCVPVDMALGGHGFDGACATIYRRLRLRSQLGAHHLV
jgi:hypothetical protein